MDNSQLDKGIAYAVVIIIGYHVVGVFVPYLTYAVMIIVVWRVVSLFLGMRK